MNLARISSNLISLVVVATLILHGVEAAAENHLLDSWQGEWGSWKQGEGGEQYEGGHISIRSCSPKSNKCSMTYHSQTPDGGCSGIGELSVLTENEASAVVRDSKNRTVDCRFIVNMESSSIPVLKVKREGSACDSVCAEDFFPASYPLIQRTMIARWRDPLCYIAPAPAYRVWCESTMLQYLSKSIGLTESNLKTWLVDQQPTPEQGQFVEMAIKRCNGDEPKACLEKALPTELARLQSEAGKVHKAYAVTGDSKTASEIIESIKGAYRKKIKSDSFNGVTYNFEHYLEIVRVSDRAVYFTTLLDIYNGHQCELSGIAEFKKIGGFVFQHPYKGVGDSRCQLLILPKRDEIIFADPSGECGKQYCGTLDGFKGETFPLSQKRSILNMKTILDSTEYLSAVSSYQKKLKKGGEKKLFGTARSIIVDFGGQKLVRSDEVGELSALR